MAIYDTARTFMRSTGNMTQWINVYPGRDLIEGDIEKGNSYVGVYDGRVTGTFAFILGEDPTYSYIEDGEWLNSLPYGTIHRIASDGTVHGFLEAAAGFASGIICNLRIDTHDDNRVMQHLLRKNGFKRCGRIYLENGDPRIAYQRYTV
jgi:hypothetical protein